MNTKLVEWSTLGHSLSRFPSAVDATARAGRTTMTLECEPGVKPDTVTVTGSHGHTSTGVTMTAGGRAALRGLCPAGWAGRATSINNNKRIGYKSVRIWVPANTAGG